MTDIGRKAAQFPEAMVKGPVRLAANWAWASAMKVVLKKRSSGSGCRVKLVTGNVSGDGREENSCEKSDGGRDVRLKTAPTWNGWS